MSGDTEYITIIKDLKNSLDELSKEFYDLKIERNKIKKIDISQPFSVLNFPSEGEFYLNKQSSVLIHYLTAIEENVLTDELLMRNGRGIELVLNNLIVDGENEIKNLLIGDYQALLVFLRSTAYGDKVEIELTCPLCSKTSENHFQLSALKFKEPKYKPSEDGKYTIQVEGLNLNFVIIQKTLQQEIDEENSNKESDFIKVEGLKIKKTRTISLVGSIESINGITNKQKITAIVKRLNRNQIKSLQSFIKENETGVDGDVEFQCSFCGELFKQNLNVGYNFISLPYSYKEIILEEIFLITYYGKGITRNDAMAMPVFERKWHIRRIKEELDKKEKAETAAYNKSKSGR